MEHDTTVTDPVVDVAHAGPATVTDPEPIAADQLVEDDLLVEEISIDGMCGVY